MATRSGNVDPGALLFLLRRGVTWDELDDALELESGLLAVSGISEDVAVLERSDVPAAAFALDVFAYRVATAVAAMSVPLHGLDALVFTAGIGEHSARVRREICAHLRFIGVELDRTRNEAVDGDAEIGAPASPVRVAVVRAREELVAARAARALLGLDGGA